MKHEYTDTQLRQAVAYFLEDEEADLSVSTLGEFFWTQQVKALRKMLDALPEPQDDWQECTIDQIREGDRVRWQVPEREDSCIYEIIVSYAISANPGWLLYSNTESYYFPPGAVVDRIPAPVQHPDPKVHAVIIVSGAYDIDWGHAYAYVSDGTGYNIVEPLNSDPRLLPEAIHNWSPAKVVEDDR